MFRLNISLRLIAALVLLWVVPCHGQMTTLGAGGTRGAAGCSQATTFLARTSGLSGTETSAYTTMICGLVTDGIITGTMAGSGSGATACGSILDALYIFATNTTTTANLNLCSTSYTITVNGSPTFTADAGYTGTTNSTTIFLDTGFDPGVGSPNFVLNSAHLSCWVLSSTPDLSCAGIRVGANDTTILPAFSGGGNVTVGRINESDANGGFTVAGAPQGWILANRSGASASQIYRNGVLATSPNTTSTSLTSGAHFYGLGFDNTSAQGSAYQQAAMTIGASMTSTQASNFYSRVCTFLTTVHGSC